MENDFTISVIGENREKKHEKNTLFISSEKFQNEHKINSTANDADEENFQA